MEDIISLINQGYIRLGFTMVKKANDSKNQRMTIS